MIDVLFNNVLGSSLGIYMKVKPALPAAKEKLQEVEIPGRDGKLVVRSGVYQSTEIPVEFNYIGPEEEWGKRWRQAKQWLSALNVEMKFSDDEDVFYKISHVLVNENTKLLNRIGTFDVVFVTKDGLSYLESGKQEYSIDTSLFNQGIVSKPQYVILGEGMCTVNVNGVKTIVNVSNNVIIDTEKMVAYRADGKLQNTAISGDYENLYLQPGENIISVTNGFKCKVIPNWRCI